MSVGLATHTTPERWLNKQVAYDLWQATDWHRRIPKGFE